MRRAAAVTLLLLLVACGGTERPEGIVERWLTSLNQGKAGRPELYAPNELSERVLPNWERIEPGQLDVIEVGKASVGGKRGAWYVPFRVKDASGRTLHTAVIVTMVGGSFRVASFADVVADHPLPSEGGPDIAGGGIVSWLAAVGVSTLFILVSIGIMSFVRRRSPA